MYQVATITGKRQLTIPADLYRKAGFSVGQKVIISLHDTGLHVESATDLVDRLAGSLVVPKAYQGMDTDMQIAKAKQQYIHSHAKNHAL